MKYFCNRFADEYIFVNCRRNSRIIIGLLIGFIVGIIFGFIFGGKGFYVDAIFDDSINFTLIIFTEKVSVGTIIFRCFLINLQSFAIIFLFSLTIYLIPLHFVFIAYKGYVLGAAVVVFTKTLGVTGFANVLILVIPQQIILLICLCLFITYTFHFTVNLKRYRCSNGIAVHLKTVLVFFVLSLINIVVQLVLIYVIIRPFNLII